jgi:hypothetical protein
MSYSVPEGMPLIVGGAGDQVLVSCLIREGNCRVQIFPSVWQHSGRSLVISSPSIILDRLEGLRPNSVGRPCEHELLTFAKFMTRFRGSVVYGGSLAHCSRRI